MFVGVLWCWWHVIIVCMIEVHELSKIGIGTFNIDLENPEMAVEVLLEQVRLGANFIDTSFMYADGGVMRFLGERFFPRVKREEIFVVTQIEPMVEKLEDIEEQLDKYLGAMDLEYVDCLMLHHPFFTKMSLIETFTAMNEMVGKGKARCLGFSNGSAEQLREVQAKFPLKVFLGLYNLENKNNEDNGIIDFCRENDIAFVAYQPLRRNRTAERNYPEMVALAEKYGRMQNQVILNWIFREKGLRALIKSSSLERTRENFGAFDFEMEKADYEILNEFWSAEFDAIEVDWEDRGGVRIDKLPNQLD